MIRDVSLALASFADDYRIVRRLHDVPPHAVYEVIVDGRRAVCKLECHPAGDPATEGRILEYVARETSVPVPRVLAVGDDFFLAEWHDGAPVDPTLDAVRARAMGETLATLHAETSFASTGLFESDDDGLVLDSRPTWAKTLCALLADCRDFLEPYGHADVAAEVIAFLRDHPDVLDGAGDPVLLHGNYLSDSVGVDGGDVSCVIDFEHALVGSGEYDYVAAAIPTFEGSSRSTTDASAAFRDGYEAVRSLPDGFDRRVDVYWSVLDVTYLRSLYLQRNWESRSAADRRAAAFAAHARETLASLRSTFE